MIRKKITQRESFFPFNPISGFTLVELSVVLVVISLLVAGGLAASVSMVNRSAYIDTRTQLQQIEESLQDYYTVNGRLPCVASLNEAISSATFGIEVGATGTTCAGGAAQSTPGHYRVDIGGGVMVRVGMLPVRTLGLSDSAAADKFGSRIVYAVTEKLTDAGQFGTAPGAITVKDASNNNILTNAAYFVTSLGRDRKGAYALSNASLVEACGSTGNLDVHNCTLNDAIFREAPFNSGTEENYFFDDLVRWAPKFHFTAKDTQSTSLWAGSGDEMWNIGTGNDLTTRVGIGTEDPEEQLHVEGDTRINGFLGINVDEPEEQLHMYGSLQIDSDDMYFMWFHNPNNANPNYQNWSLQDTNNTGVLTFKSRHSTWLAKDILLSMDHATGNVGINTETPASRLHVNGDARFGNQVLFTQSGANSYMHMGYGGATNANIYGGVTSSARLDLSASDSGVEGASIDLNGRATGNVGRIGYIASTGVTNGTSAHYFGTRNAAGTIVFLGEIYSNGSMTLQGAAGTCNLNTGTGATSCTSDARLKRDVTPIGDALEKLKSIKGIFYRWNDKADTADHILDKETRRIGVLAQDVQKVFPEAVQEGENGYLMVSLEALIPALIESVKELDAQNQSLRSKVDDLETRLAALEQQSAGAAAPSPFDWRSAFIFLLIFGTAMLLYMRLKHKP